MVLDNIDKSNWESFPFEKIAKRIAETVDPKNTDLEIYYGLEHLDGETIHIRRNGTPDDVKGGKLKCYPGDIIFGKRRAYQRKAGIVKQAGICSAHAFVFRANEELIDARLFPFFLHSDQFMHRMVDISVGGLSPTINWSDLKHQEFLLPPKEQQAELAELLWAMDEVIEKDLEVLAILEKTYNKFINEEIKKPTEDFYFFKELYSFRKGLTYKSEEYGNEESGKPLLNLKSIARGGGFNRDGVKYYDGDYQDKHIVKNNDLVVACTDITRGGAVVGFPLHPNVYQDKEMLFTMDLIAIESKNEKFERDFMYYLLKSDWAHNFLFAYSPGTTVLHLDTDGLNRLKIPKISKGDQIKIIKKLQSLESIIDNLESKINSSKALQKALINQIF